jgi:AcrR family transcriptional regulator
VQDGGPRRHNDPVDQTQRILQAALECYTHYGLQRTTMATVARLAGVSRATVYRHFPGPRALQDAAMDLVAADVRREVLAMDRPQDSLEQFICTYFTVLMAYLIPMRSNQQILEERETIPWALYQDNEQSTRTFVARLLRHRLQQSRERNELDPEVSDADVAEAVWAAVRTITSIRSSPVVNMDDPADVGRWFSRMVFRGLARPPAG